MNTLIEIGIPIAAFVAGVFVGAKNATKINATVVADTAKLKADVAALQTLLSRATVTTTVSTPAPSIVPPPAP